MLSDEEFFLLWENYKSTNSDFPWDSYDPFTLVNMDEAECKAEFRVEKKLSPQACRSLANFRNIEMLPRNRMRWNGGTMHAVETTVIPLSFQ